MLLGPGSISSRCFSSPEALATAHQRTSCLDICQIGLDSCSHTYSATNDIIDAPARRSQIEFVINAVFSPVFDFCLRLNLGEIAIDDLFDIFDFCGAILFQLAQVRLLQQINEEQRDISRKSKTWCRTVSAMRRRSSRCSRSANFGSVSTRCTLPMWILRSFNACESA